MAEEAPLLFDFMPSLFISHYIRSWRICEGCSARCVHFCRAAIVSPQILFCLSVMGSISLHFCRPPSCHYHFCCSLTILCWNTLQRKLCVLCLFSSALLFSLCCLTSDPGLVVAIDCDTSYLPTLDHSGYELCVSICLGGWWERLYILLL